MRLVCLILLSACVLGEIAYQAIQINEMQQAQLDLDLKINSVVFVCLNNNNALQDKVQSQIQELAVEVDNLKTVLGVANESVAKPCSKTTCTYNHEIPNGRPKK